MRFYRTAALALGACVAWSSALRAQDRPRRIQFTGDVGLVSASGNSSVTTVNVGDKVLIQTADKKRIFTQTFALVYGRSEGEVNASNWRAGTRLDYGLSARLYLFGQLGLDRNRFAGIDRRFEEGAGLAWRVVADAQDLLGLEGGLSLFQQRNTSASDGGLDDNFTAARAALAYKHDFSKTAFLSQNLEFLPNLNDTDDWRLNSESALVSPISQNVVLKVSYVIRYDHLPPLRPPPNPLGERFKQTDRLFTAGVQVTF